VRGQLSDRPDIERLADGLDVLPADPRPLRAVEPLAT
jgi:hypothetical protein